MKTEEKESAEDLLLVHRTLQGHPDAFEQILEKYQHPIFNLCLRMLGNDEDAKEITQETFLKLYRQLPKYKPGKRLFSWCYTIALNRCRNFLRRKKLIHFFSLDHWRKDEKEDDSYELPSPDPCVERNLEKKEMADLAEKMLDALPSSLKAPFLLRIFQDLSYEEISEISGLSVANVKVRIHRAKMFLWKRFGKKVKESVTL